MPPPLTALTQDDNRVRVRFSDATSGDYDLVVGADGIHSTVRELAANTGAVNA
jgi:2-polyprenyl-6-methoxyphenol hydroxylase-like FAD-dependent oxidoreductase